MQIRSQTPINLDALAIYKGSVQNYIIKEVISTKSFIDKRLICLIDIY